MEVYLNYSLKQLNTFGIDVRAHKFAVLNSDDEVVSFLKSDKLNGQTPFILGGGSNILFVSDVKRPVIKINIPGISVTSEDENSVTVSVGAGVVWHDLVLFAIRKNLGGIENLSLIPGTTGAAPIQNIGAYGQELSDVFKSLKGIYIHSGDRAEFSKDECRFGYRNSIFKHELKSKFIITEVSLTLKKNPVLNLDYGNVKNELTKLGKNDFTVKDVSEVICSIRNSKLPDPGKLGNAGSFFKNPEVSPQKLDELKKNYHDIVYFILPDGNYKLAAGWLIEQCGWKGKKIGDAGVHEKQALVIVNYGNASGKDILKLASEIKSSVLDTFGITLEEEINIIE